MEDGSSIGTGQNESKGHKCMTREDVIRRIVERDVQNLGLSPEVVLQGNRELHVAACGHFGTWETALHYAGISKQRIVAVLETSPKRVLRKVHSLCVGGYNLSPGRILRRDRRLYEAARTHFGTWHRALLAAGINLKYVRLPRKPRRLDRVRIIEALRQRNELGDSLAWRIACTENRAFAMAAKNAFRSWRRALLAAGLLPEEPPVVLRWDIDRILHAIRLRHRGGKPLNRARVRDEEPSLVSAAQQHFGTWSDALKAAGVTSAPES